MAPFKGGPVTNETIALQRYMESVLLSSKTLSSAEQSYLQTEKEALSPIYGLSKFHQYLYARHFIIVTDHKPLHANVGPKKNILTLAALRMQHWALLFSTYNYRMSIDI